jgi:penicillin-binding protein 1C
VGNASGEAMHDVSGVSGAAPIWQALVRHLHTNSPSRPPAAPVGVVRASVEFDRGLEPPRPEVFIAGTEASRKGGEPHGLRASPFGIASPVDGSLFAVDPDIPPAAQKITFEGEHGTWVLDGKRLGAGRLLRWAPWPGRHELTLLGDQRQSNPERALRGPGRGRQDREVARLNDGSGSRLHPLRLTTGAATPRSRHRRPRAVPEPWGPLHRRNESAGRRSRARRGPPNAWVTWS